MLAGFNEIMLFYSLGFPFLILFMFLISGKTAPAPVFVQMGFNMLLAFIVLKLPGNNARSDNFEQTQSIVTSAVGSAYRTIKTLLPLVSNPLFYVSCLGITTVLRPFAFASSIAFILFFIILACTGAVTRFCKRL